MSATVVLRFADGSGVDLDLSRIGQVAGESDDGRAVEVEPDIDGWDGVRDDTRAAIVRAVFAACGHDVTVEPGHLP